MALWRAIPWFSILIMVAFVISSSPLPHSSNTCFQVGRKVTNMLEVTAITRSNQGRRGGNTGINSGVGAEESAREVPTGPDPLHHHDITPSGP